MCVGLRVSWIVGFQFALSTRNNPHDLQSVAVLYHAMRKLAGCDRLAVVFHHYAAGRYGTLLQEFLQCTRQLCFNRFPIGHQIAHLTQGQYTNFRSIMQAYAKQIVKMQRPPMVRAQALEMVLLVG